MALTLAVILTGCASKKMTVKQDEDANLSPGLRHITDISIVEDSELVKVSISGDSQLIYTSFKQPVPFGVILYFPETGLAEINSEYNLDNDIISSIKVSELTGKGHTSKIEVLLKKDVTYNVTREGAGIKLTFDKPAAESSDLSFKEPKKEKTIEKKTPQIKKTIIRTKVDASKETGPEEVTGGAYTIKKDDKSGKQILAPKIKPSTDKNSDNIKANNKGLKTESAWVNRIDFSSEDAGKSTIIIGTTIPVKYEILKSGDKILQFKLFNTRIPLHQRRQLITTRFNSAVDRIIPFQSTEDKDISIVSIELREKVPYFVEQSADILMIHFDPSSIPPKPFVQANLPAWKKAMHEVVVESDKVEEKKAVDISSTSSDSSDFSGSGALYTGEKIALDFYETDIKNVFRILREVSGKNFAIDKDVAGTVTLTIEKPVPWDQVLHLILRMNQLGTVMDGDIIRIATLKSLAREEKAKREWLTAEKNTKEQKQALGPLEVEYIPINYSNAKEEILPHLEPILTPKRGTISVDERNNQIILTDVKEKIIQAKEIIYNIDKVTPQVIIEARVVEVSKNFALDIGIDWSSSGGTTDPPIEGSQSVPGHGPQRGFNLLGGTYGYNTVMNFPVPGTSSIGFNFTRLLGTPLVLNARLNALEVNGEVNIISAPKIVTLDNKKAKIKQGLEVAYLERDDAGGSSVKFKDVDLLLEVTPHVTPDNRISMVLFITKNDVVDASQETPALSTNEAETELLVNDGDTIVIGGIMKTSSKISENAFPFLSKIPLVGWLFKSSSNSNNKNELLIFITPKIVRLERIS